MDGDITKAPTCSEKGTQAQSCVCGATNVKELDEDASNHADYGTETVGAVDAKCNADGYTGDIRCVRCHAVLQTGTVISKDTVAHTPGDWTETDRQNSTCKVAGWVKETKSCTVCGTQLDERTTDLSLAAHTPGEPVRENETAATCTKAASYDEVVTCTVCTAELSRTTKTEGTPLGHSWSAWTVTKNATCSEAGSKTRTCSNDPSHVETVEIPKTAHTDADGDNHCDVCGQQIDNSFRCSFCSTYEANRGRPVIGWFYIIVHFFIHLIQQLRAWK